MRELREKQYEHDQSNFFATSCTARVAKHARTLSPQFSRIFDIVRKKCTDYVIEVTGTTLSDWMRCHLGAYLYALDAIEVALTA